MHVVVAGGGLAGLVAARHLAETGVDVELFEKRTRVGGRVGSRVVDGFTLDRGFQVLFSAYPAARRELDLDALELRSFAPGATIAAPNHRSTLADPLADPGAAIATLFNRDVSMLDKYRLFRLRRELRETPVESILDAGSSDGDGDAEPSVREYLETRGFSRRFIERFAEPFYGGITLDRSLSSSSRVFEYTFRMLAEGETAVPAEGMGAIPAQLLERVEDAGATVRTGKAVTDLEADGGSVTVEAGNERVFPDAAVVATDPRTAGELTGVETPASVRGCVTVHCSLPDRQVLDTGSHILLNAEDQRPNTVAPLSAAAPEYAPEGEQLLSATFLDGRVDGGAETTASTGATDDDTGAGDDTPVVDATDADLGESVRSDLESWYPENNFADLEVVDVDRIEFAQFAQPPGFRSRLPSVDDSEGSVYLAGDYTRWSSIQGALESGKRAADAVLADLG